MRDKKKLAEVMAKEHLVRQKFLGRVRPPINFQAMCKEVCEASGLSKCGIERVLDSNDGWVHRLVGKPKRRPMHDFGENLVTLWEVVTGKTREDAPRR